MHAKNNPNLNKWIELQQSLVFRSIFCYLLFSKSKRDKKDKKKGKKVKKLQGTDSDDGENACERNSNLKQIKSKDQLEDDNDVSSDEEQDIGRGEGDVQSSSDEEDEQRLGLQKAQVRS